MSILETYFNTSILFSFTASDITVFFSSDTRLHLRAASTMTLTPLKDTDRDSLAFFKGDYFVKQKNRSFLIKTQIFL